MADEVAPPDARRTPVTHRVRRRAVPNATGLPDGLKSAVEHLGGTSLDDVRVRYGSTKPAALDAVAYTQGNRIEVASGHEQHLAHEAWHVVQQHQGRVDSRIRLGGHSINDDVGLEREADVMGDRAVTLARRTVVSAATEVAPLRRAPVSTVVQREIGIEVGTAVTVYVKDREIEDGSYPAIVMARGADDATYTVDFKDADYNQYVADRVFPQNVVKRAVVAAARVVAAKGPWEGEHLGLEQGVIASIKRIVGDATSITELSEQQLEELIEILMKVDQPLGGVTRLLQALRADLLDLIENNEPAEVAEERRQRLEERTSDLEQGAFSDRFGRTTAEATEYGPLAVAIETWFEEVKAAEGQVEFEAAYRANRMTARQVNIGDTARGGEFQARHHGARPDTEHDRTMMLDSTLTGIGKRQQPENFADRAAINREGVHNLSASILRGDGGQGIFEQLKFYKDSVALFVPLPLERDLQIFSALAKWQHMDPGVMRRMESLLTRPVLAQASDMGTVYVDTTPGSDGEGSFQYGITGTVIRKRNDRARRINPADEANRRLGAITYTEVATAAITKVNEVVMAYRSHESALFPMFGKWDEANKRFTVVGPDKQPTGALISNTGVYTPP